MNWSRAARRREAAVRRLPVLIVVVAVLAGLAVAEQRRGEEQAAAQATVSLATGDDPLRLALTGRAGVVAPVDRPDGALTSTWFCAGATVGGSGAKADVVVVNPGDEPGEAVVTVYGAAADTDPNAAAIAELGPAASVVGVPAASRVTVDLATLTTAPFASVLVETSGAMLVEQRSTDPTGSDTHPCATSAAGSWFFAAGSTARDAREHLSLFNPFADDAVVDVVFATSDGFRSPGQYQGIIVPAGELIVVDLLAAISRHDHVATSVLARSGRLVAGRTQSFDGSLGPKGTAVTVGSAEPAREWWFADGITEPGLVAVYSIFNPTTDAAEVEMSVVLDDAEINGEIDPIPYNIPAQSYVNVAMNDAQLVPIGLGHSVLFESVGPTPVVVERRMVAMSPSTRTGLSYTAGSPFLSSRWSFAAGSGASAGGERVSLYNPSDREASILISAVVGGSLVVFDEFDLDVAAGGRVVLDMTHFLEQAPEVSLIIETSVPVAAERRQQPSDDRGVGQSMGVMASPLGDG